MFEISTVKRREGGKKKQNPATQTNTSTSWWHEFPYYSHKYKTGQEYYYMTLENDQS